MTVATAQPAPVGRLAAPAGEKVWCVETLSSLCSVDTTSGREARLLPHLERILVELGAELTIQTVTSGRINVLARWGRPRVLLTTHLDTVAPFLPPRRAEDALYGRGACDAKGQIVAQLAAICRHLESGSSDIAWLAVAGEETDGAGAAAALELAPHLPELEAVIGGEPTENRLATSQAGFLHLTLRCSGRRGHGAVGRPGESALWHLHDWLGAIRSRPEREHPVFGRESFNLGMIRGGEGANVVAGEATADLVVRTVPDSDFVEVCRALAPEGSEVIVRLDEPPSRLSSWPGLDDGPVGFGSDVPRLSALAPSGRAFLLGPGSIRFAHRDDEHLRWDELGEGIDLLTGLVRELLGTTGGAS
ncbi:MAG: M20/M25/M40 family metallo-hydrolase [Thermoanaerobaculia bacterium]|nr:M20/M25/M40 family metallo-hydrolase [Thermoanaerobaculia bacterium]